MQNRFFSFFWLRASVEDLVTVELPSWSTLEDEHETPCSLRIMIGLGRWEIVKNRCTTSLGGGGGVSKHFVELHTLFK